MSGYALLTAAQALVSQLAAIYTGMKCKAKIPFSNKQEYLKVCKHTHNEAPPDTTTRAAELPPSPSLIHVGQIGAEPEMR